MCCPGGIGNQKTNCIVNIIFLYILFLLINGIVDIIFGNLSITIPRPIMVFKCSVISTMRSYLQEIISYRMTPPQTGTDHWYILRWCHTSMLFAWNSFGTIRMWQEESRLHRLSNVFPIFFAQFVWYLTNCTLGFFTLYDRGNPVWYSVAVSHLFQASMCSAFGYAFLYITILIIRCISLTMNLFITRFCSTELILHKTTDSQ